MSMLSAQCDELRSMAESVGLEVPQAATLMMEAADTIWELRCKCAGMVDMRERARLAETENAKLRELLGGVGHLLFILDVDYCVACPRDSISHPCPVYTIKGGECLYKSDMRELGIEVDG